MENFQRLFESFTNLKVGVIGDVMLDTYMWGRVDRISPEAPVPVVLLDEKEWGGGVSSFDCHSLSFKFLFYLLGDDTEGCWSF
jgi:bifunctional ADP-heptose synthase (sugar kinase/adenylyltransferase)